MKSLKTIWLIARNDMALELRRREIVLTILGFSTLVFVIFTFTLDIKTYESQKFVPGIFWSAIAFAYALGLNKRFASEIENGTFEGLLLAPISRDIIFIGKFLGNFCFLFISTLISLPITTLLFNISLFRIESLLICLVISVGLSTLGTLFSIMTVRVRAKEIMLPLLFLPAISPLLLAGVESMSTLTIGSNYSEIKTWISFAVAYDLLFLVISVFLFHYTVQE